MIGPSTEYFLVDCVIVWRLQNNTIVFIFDNKVHVGYVNENNSGIRFV